MMTGVGMGRRADDAGVSLSKGLVGLIGLALLAYGISGLIFAGHRFRAHAISGTVSGTAWLGVDANGWTNLLFAAAGAVLVLASPRHRGATSTALAVAVVLGAAAGIALLDGRDVLGVLAANGLPTRAWGAAAVALLAVALLPRVVARERDDDHAELGRRAAQLHPVREPIRFGRDRANVDDPWSWPRDLTERAKADRPGHGNDTA